MHVLANDDDDGSNDASDLVEERSSLAQPMNSHEAVKNEKKKRIFQTHFKARSSHLPLLQRHHFLPVLLSMTD